MSTRDESCTTGTVQGCQHRKLIVSWHVRPEEERELERGLGGGAERMEDGGWRMGAELGPSHCSPGALLELQIW